ncbi:UV-B-induced protein-like, chloroplastic [Iris pallida]|uniref:UV-B-induced protein-like, chloroplastic n=1 Tax=Iris pallida TaxID=29817 RepID=A0AAX6EPH0_IRIPA|nr:UV-B-induced protein-like, chloroplastic [Iris pallida]
MNMKVCSLKSGVVAVFPSSSSSSSSLRFLSPSLNLRSSNSFTKLKIRAEIPIIPKFVKAYSPYNRPPPPPAMAPLQLKSPSGKLLLHTLTAHPHLLPSTIDQQLDRLEADAAAADRHDNLEEILYCIIVHKFTENSIRMITMIPTCQLDYQEEDRHKLEAAHTDDAMDMIEGHLTFVQDKFGAHPGKLRLGKLYSASVKFGYYLKRVDERFQLEKKMDTLPTVHVGDVESAILYDCDDEEDDLDNLSYGLRAYIRGLDKETLRRFATVRSEEAMSLIGKHEKALFGDSAMSALASGIGSSGLAMLVLEAVAFGSFLWEAECYIESKCKFFRC